jgi:O-antigen ligase
VVLKRVLVPVLLLLCAVAAVPSARAKGLSFVAERIGSIFDLGEDPSNVFRVLDAANAWTSFVQHPLMGVGAGGRYDLEFVSQHPKLMQFMEEVNRTSHDGYLYVLFKAGIIGFVCYAAVFAAYMRKWMRTQRLAMSALERAVFAALGAIVVAFLVNNLTEPISDTLRPSMLLAFVMSWGAIAMRELGARGSTVA